MPFTHALSTNNYGTARFIVDANPANGTHTTIASAIAAASNGDVIILKPGTFTENLTISKNLTFFSYGAALREATETSTIVGKITVSGNNIMDFFGIIFITNGDNSFLLSGSGATVTCENCYFSATNANSISVTGDVSTEFYLENCSGEIQGTNLLVTATVGGVWIENSAFLGDATAGNSTTSGGAIRIFDSEMNIPFSTTSIGVVIIKNTSFGGQQTPFLNKTWITLTGSGNSYVDNSTFNSGTSSAISVGTGTTLTIVGARINSSNTNAITGAGTINYGDVVFSGTSSTNNVSTQVSLIASELHEVVNQVFTTNGTYTPSAGLKYCSVRILGGGGAGGGGPSTGLSQYSSGAGGGSGEYAEGIFSASTIGASQAVTIGAAGTGNSGATGGNGGNTSLGALISANGGTGGTSLAATGGGEGPINGGAGGTGGSGGDFRTPGQLGGPTIISFLSNLVIPGAGANSQIGSGGSFTVLGTGGAASGYGAGGGGTFNGTSQSAITGGAGSAGVVIITEYI